MAGEDEVHVALLDDGQPEVADLGRVGALRPAPEGRCVHQHDRPPVSGSPPGPCPGMPPARPSGRRTSRGPRSARPGSRRGTRSRPAGGTRCPASRSTSGRPRPRSRGTWHQDALLVVADRDHPVAGPRRTAHRREQVGPLGPLVRPVDHIPGLQHQLRPGRVGQGPAQRRARDTPVVDLGVAEADDGQGGGCRVGGREGAPLAGTPGGDDPVLVGGARREAGERGRVAGLRRAGELHRGGGSPSGAHLLGRGTGYAVGDPLPLRPGGHGPGDPLRGGRIRGRGQQDP